MMPPGETVIEPLDCKVFGRATIAELIRDANRDPEPASVLGIGDTFETLNGAIIVLRGNALVRNVIACLRALGFLTLKPIDADGSGEVALACLPALSMDRCEALPPRLSLEIHDDRFTLEGLGFLRVNGAWFERSAPPKDRGLEEVWRANFKPEEEGGEA